MDPLQYLLGLEHFGIKFGLHNIAAIVDRLGHPERTYASVHIAGTNGKGSVTAMVDAALRAAGHRSARYTSPHLVDLTERFVVDGRPVATAALSDAVADVRDAIDALRAEGLLDVHPTFFEVTTAAAFELFRRERAAIAVLEVGLGGRLDATNVAAPIVCALTSIAFDHERHLGSTLKDIAFEKAGIIKPATPVVIPQLPPDAMQIVERTAHECGAPLIRTAASDVDGRDVGLAGMHQRANAAVAAGILGVLSRRGFPVPDEAVAAGLAHPGWPGRLDLRILPDGRELLMDAAHNPAGARAMASYLMDRPAAETKLPLVFAAMRDKSIGGMLEAVAPVVGELVVTRASNPRSADPAAIASLARIHAPSVTITIAPLLTDALDAAWRRSRRIVIAGSIFLLGDVMEHLGLH